MGFLAEDWQLFSERVGHNRGRLEKDGGILLSREGTADLGLSLGRLLGSRRSGIPILFS